MKLSATANLRGRMLLGDDEPLAGVRVSATARGTSFGPSSPTRQFHAETGQDGRYRMEGLAPGLYDLWTQRSGGLGFGGPVIRVPYVGRIDLHLTNGAIIRGRVTAKDSGKPVAGAVVQMTGGSFGMGNPDQALARAVSGPKGWYELHTCHDFMNGPPAIHGAGLPHRAAQRRRPVESARGGEVRTRLRPRAGGRARGVRDRPGWTGG